MATEFVIDADDGYVAPEIPDTNLTLGGVVYRLSSPEPAVWASIVGMEDGSEESALSFLKNTMRAEDFESLKDRVYDPADGSVDVFRVIRATTLVGMKYGELISQHFADLDGAGVGNRRQRRTAAQQGGSGQVVRSVPTRKAVVGSRKR